jgi:hypothetical protein
MSVGYGEEYRPSLQGTISGYEDVIMSPEQLGLEPETESLDVIPIDEGQLSIDGLKLERAAAAELDHEKRLRALAEKSAFWVAVAGVLRRILGNNC